MSGAFETPLIDDVLGLRIAGTYTEADGWFENINSGVEDGEAIDEYGLRVSLAWQPSDGLEAILRYTKTDQNAVNYGIQPFNVSPDGVGGGVYSLYNSLGLTDKVDYQRDRLSFWEFESDQDDKRELSNDGVSLSFNWDISDHYTLTSISSWDDGKVLNPEDTDGSPLPVLSIPYYGEAEQWSQDLRVASSLDGSFNFIAGAYWSSEEVYNATNIGFYQDLDMNGDGSLDFLDCVDVVSTAFEGGPTTDAGIAIEGTLNELDLSLADLAPAGCQFDNEFDQKRTSQAAYFDASYMVNESWTLRLGLRYTQDETELSGFSARILAADGTPVTNTIPGDADNPFAIAVSQSESESEWTGKLGIDYMSEGGMLLYGNVSHGYRSGAFNAQAFVDPSELAYVEPETIDAFELGLKHELLDGRLRLNAAAFFYSYENQQFLNIEGVIQTLVNIDESEVLGMEMEVHAAITPNLIVQAGLGLLDTEVKQGVLSGVDLEGNALLLAPETNFNVAVTWDIAEFDAGRLSLRADTNFVGDYHFDVYNTDRIASNSYWLHNARLDFIAIDEQWHVGVWVKNLADEEYFTSAIDLQTFGFDYGHLGAPRTYGMELRLNF
ncbi:MAG: TonB-dependent receptor [Halioglobus sp.]